MHALDVFDEIAKFLLHRFRCSFARALLPSFGNEFLDLIFQQSPSPLVFRFTIFWEEVIVIIKERWAVDYRGNLGGCGQG